MSDVLQALNNFTYGGATSSGLFKDKIKNEYNLEELDSIISDFDKRCQLVVTGAGTGKTTALKLSILSGIYDGKMQVKGYNFQGIEVPEVGKIWVSTFLKSGAEDMEREIRKSANTYGITLPNSIRFSTLHAEFYQVLGALGVSVSLIDGLKEFQIGMKMLKKFEIIKYRAPTPYDVQKLLSFVSLVRNNLSSSIETTPEMEQLGLDVFKLKLIANEMKKERVKLKVLDYEDLQELLYTYLVEKPNDKIIDFIQQRYDFIFIDEFQDVSYIQYEILKVYFKKAKKIFMIGDDDQLIYSWRGGGVDIITEKVIRDFNPSTYKLTVNYRCPQNILTPIVRSLENNQQRFKKDLKSSKDGGVLEVISTPNELEQLSVLEDEIRSALRRGESITILGRTNNSLLSVCIHLELEMKLDYSLLASNVSMERGTMQKLLRLAYISTEINSYITDNLAFLFNGDVSFWERKNIKEYLTLNSVRFADFDLDIARGATRSEKLPYFLEKIKGLEGLSLYNRVLSYIKETNPVGDVVRCVDVLQNIIQMNLGKWDIYNFMDYMDTLNEKFKARYKRKSSQGITVSTVHGYKGLEADNIVVFNAIDGEFPSNMTLEGDEEERRIFYIANTRARKRNIILTNDSEQSPFIKEMMVEVKTQLPSSSVFTLEKGGG